MRWVSLSCVIDIRRYVFSRLRAEKDLSLVPLVAGITRTWRRTRITSEKKRRDSEGKSRKNLTMSVMVLTSLFRTQGSTLRHVRQRLSSKIGCRAS
ncbi:hypothetical protein DPMN_051255 [Dreissena polymorpha]|uniref:Uncharacterized protein n=1 Tax=Dreissena polymorpha TaxID=45954 RepID=A0A9D4CJ19_DREPO|nr:hypothetical protein DPMN_051255 [Dreissena polymorpha]